MPNEDDKLQAKESPNNNDSLTDSKKIDLYINNNDAEMTPGISIMNIFRFMKQRFHIYIFVMIATTIVGLLVPMFSYIFSDKNESGVSLLGLDYTGANAGKTPDGKDLDISYIKSSYIIQNALNDVVLSKPMTVALVQPNLTVTGVLSDETKQQQDILAKLEADKSNAYAEALKNFTLKYRPQYIITLANGFKDGNKTIQLSNNELTALLASISKSYNDYFNETYQDTALPENHLAAMDEATLDYLDILDQVSNSLNYLEAYCNGKANKYGGFRASDGMSFADLSRVVATVKNSDIDYITSYIETNNISKDRYLQLTNYTYQRRQVALELDKVKENIKTVQASIDAYQKDKVVITNPETGQTTTVDVTSDYYNQLVNNLTTLNETKSSYEKTIAILDERIARLEGAEATEAQKSKADLYVDQAVENAKKLYDSVLVHTEELFASSMYRDGFMHSITTTSKSSTLKDNIKTIGIGAGLGLLAGVAIWVIDAFILEVKHNRKVIEMMEAARNEK